jgi:hypothetical protein
LERAAQKLGARFLPLAPGWLLLMPVVEIALAFLSPKRGLAMWE